MIKFIWFKYKKHILILAAIGLVFFLGHNLLSSIQEHLDEILRRIGVFIHTIGLPITIFLITMIGWVLNFFGIPTYFSIMIVTFLVKDWKIGFIYALLFEMFCFSTQLFLSRFIIGHKITKKYQGNQLYLWINEHVESLGYVLFVILRYMPAFAYEVQNYMLGVTTIKWKKFVFYSGLVSLPANLMITYIAYSVAQLSAATLAIAFLLAVGLNLILFFIIMICAMLFDKNKSEEVKKAFMQGKEMFVGWYKNLQFEKEKFLYENKKD